MTEGQAAGGAAATAAAGAAAQPPTGLVAGVQTAEGGVTVKNQVRVLIHPPCNY